ncbi:small ribosomal subunit protein uS9m isoform X2 [Chrysemys picta bellii]|uniref:small ribosomal subunit protein uS9m isoform X2 n=1 Tax=Chrysemys picta bellii TaxID=8478 RepID=UPI0032B2AC0A
MAAAVRRVVRASRAWSAALRAREAPGAQTLRLIYTTTTVQKRNVAALGPEKYTEAFIKNQIEEFNLGKRHLANMMGEDPETFTQEDIDKAIAYLFPSGLFEKRARPIMKEIYGKLLDIQKYQDHLRAQGLLAENRKKINLIGSRWLIKEELEDMLVEKLSDHDYSTCIQLLERLVTLPCCGIEEEYVLKFRRELAIQLKKMVIEPLQYDEQGVAFSTGEGKRKTSRATAVVYDHGSGKITVNGVDYLCYFPVMQDREQLMFPFQFLDRLGIHDMVCTVSGGGRSSQAGAIRLASARALCSFISENEVEFMRQAGLLTPDPRIKERKKPGQEGARRKFTWKKR